MAAFGYGTTMLNHVAISFVRLNAITQPTTYMTATKKAVSKRILVVWVIGVLLGSHQLIASHPEWPAEYDEHYRCQLSKVSMREGFSIKLS